MPDTKTRLLAAVKNGDTTITFGKVQVNVAPTGDFFRVEVPGDQPEGFKWDELTELAYWEGALVDDAVVKIDAALKGKPAKGEKKEVAKITIVAEGMSLTDLVGITKPYDKVSDAPANIRELDDAKLTLAQVNWIANVADGLKGKEGIDNPWAVAIGQFKRSFKKEDGKWVAKKPAEEKKPKEEKKESWQAKMDEVRGAFDAQFDVSEDKVSRAPWLKDIFDGHVIVDDEGQLYRVSYVEGEGGFRFVARPDWQKVTLAYTPEKEKALLPIADKGGGWDAAAAKGRVAKWASSDGSGDKDKINWSKYGRAFFYSSGEDSFGAFKLPFADVKDDTLTAIPEGIYAAAQAVQGARTPMKIPLEGLKKQVAAYYKKMDEEAPWKRESKEGKREGKEPSLSEQEQQIRDNFLRRFGPSDAVPVEDFYVREVYGGHLIAGFKGKLYRFPFAKREGGQIDEWQEVEVAYVPVGLAKEKEPVMKMAVAVAKAMLKRQKSAATVWMEGDDRYYLALISMAIFDEENQIVEKEGMDSSIALAQKHGYKSGMYIRHVVPRSLVGRCMYERRIGPYWVEVGKFKDTPLAEWAFEILEKDKEGKWKLSIGFITTKDQAEKGRYTRLLKYDTTITDRPALPVTAVLAVGGKTEMNDMAKLLTFLNPQSEEEKEKATAMLGDLFGVEEKELAAVVKEAEQLEALRKALDEAGIKDEDVRAKIVAALDEDEPPVQDEPADLSEQIQGAVTAAMTGVEERLAALEERPGAVEAVKEIGDLLRKRSQSLPRPTETAPVVEGVTDLVEKIDKHIGDTPGPRHPLAGFAGGPGPSEGG